MEGKERAMGETEMHILKRIHRGGEGIKRRRN
jgi:hypothetical protein